MIDKWYAIDQSWSEAKDDWHCYKFVIHSKLYKDRPYKRVLSDPSIYEIAAAHLSVYGCPTLEEFTDIAFRYMLYTLETNKQFGSKTYVTMHILGGWGLHGALCDGQLIAASEIAGNIPFLKEDSLKAVQSCKEFYDFFDPTIRRWNYAYSFIAYFKEKKDNLTDPDRAIDLNYAI